MGTAKLLAIASAVLFVVGLVLAVIGGHAKGVEECLFAGLACLASSAI